MSIRERSACELYVILRSHREALYGIGQAVWIAIFSYVGLENAGSPRSSLRISRRLNAAVGPSDDIATNLLRHPPGATNDHAAGV